MDSPKPTAEQTVHNGEGKEGKYGRPIRLKGREMLTEYPTDAIQATWRVEAGSLVGK